MERERIEARANVHGCLVQWEGMGILLTGDSGVGKTICALEISRRGGIWIADDIAVLSRRPDHTLSGRAHEKIRNLVHLRAEGIIDIRSWPSLRIATETRVDINVELIKKLEKVKKKGLTAPHMREIMEVGIPCAHVAVLADTPRTVDAVLNCVGMFMGEPKGGVSSCR
jgi:HPr kinase/phosphorylase